MGVITGGVGGAQAFSKASGGKIYAYNNISDVTLRTVAAINPSRQKITFHNPGTVDILVGPAFVQNTGSNVALVPTTTVYGGCFRVFGGGGTLEITGECQGAWQALALSGTTNPLTVMESNT